MDSLELKEALLSFCRNNLLSIVLFVGGLMLLGYGFFVLFPQASNEVQFETESNVVTPSSQKQQVLTIVVDVAGAVKKPGVYTLPENSRIQAAITKAGGFSEKADTEGIAKKINLASLIVDGQKIYIPFEGESVLGSTVGDMSSESGHININEASETTLDTLSGVGPVTAQKIITNRPYQTINELVTKKVVSEKVFEQIKDNISSQ